MSAGLGALALGSQASSTTRGVSHHAGRHDCGRDARVPRGSGRVVGRVRMPCLGAQASRLLSHVADLPAQRCATGWLDHGRDARDPRESRRDEAKPSGGLGAVPQLERAAPDAVIPGATELTHDRSERSS